ncbi:hypothetical protein [Nonlabens spongiae]|uniref:hypothetical protein n=1 Tax=Nonlabens spongiae TaxID=331648 RepID=UPI000A26E63C|nr:hypothetical protein [Nonlabens spongiae]
MRSQLSIFFIYPVVIGLSILGMSNVSIDSSENFGKSKVFADDFEPDFSGPLFNVDDAGDDYDPSSFQFYNHSAPLIPSKGYIAFKEALARKESLGRYQQVNSLGYLGKYQFGSVTLRHFGVYNTSLFLNTPSVQERVFNQYLNYNHDYLKSYIEKYDGKVVGGIKVTESGILAAAHLSGPGGVKRFFNSNGRLSSRDAYGSSVKYYMKKFADYNVSSAIR